MNTENRQTNSKSSGDKYQVLRMTRKRRVSQGRRDMIRFDEKGGDRRSGTARRGTDEGLREQSEEDQAVKNNS